MILKQQVTQGRSPDFDATRPNTGLNFSLDFDEEISPNPQV
jgi:hypothetical protein